MSSTHETSREPGRSRELASPRLWRVAWRRRLWHLPLGIAAMALLGCVTRPIVDPELGAAQQNVSSFPQSLEKDVDILFLVDDSRSMLSEQQLLADNFPLLINALRNHKLGPSAGGGTCTEQDESGCKIPNVHIGVISPNLGAGPYTFVETCTVEGGLQGKLLNQKRASADCPAPSDPWISYTVEGEREVTNVPSSGRDPVATVAESFSCIAKLGKDGCGFEQQLEAARLALDPTEKRNEGFVRDEALLAVVFITDEDDCSAADPQLFNTRDFSYGPSNWRCFEAGVTCEGVAGDAIREPGPRTNCEPGGNLLKPVTARQSGRNGKSYEEFFKGLKTRADGRPRPGRVIMAALAGPPAPVTVRIREGVGPGGGPGPDIAPSCSFTVTQNDRAEAFPGIRMQALISAFEPGSEEVPGTFEQICPQRANDDNFPRTLKKIGERIRAALGRQCISSPLLRADGGLACAAGEDLGGGQTCDSPGCLEEVDCQVEESTDDSKPQEVPRCPVALFNDLAATSCSEAPCPCWRIIPNDACSPAEDGSPYSLQILRQANTEPKKGTFADVLCNASPHPWGSERLFQSLDDDGDAIPERICR